MLSWDIFYLLWKNYYSCEQLTNLLFQTHPQDIDRWIEFVHYQDDVVSADSISTSASNLKRSIVDIQLSILKRAQILNPKELRYC